MDTYNWGDLTEEEKLDVLEPVRELNELLESLMI